MLHWSGEAQRSAGEQVWVILVKSIEYLLVRLLFLPFVPLIYLCGYIAEWQHNMFGEQPEFTAKNVAVLAVCIIFSPLIIVMTPIQKAYIRHLKESIEDS